MPPTAKEHAMPMSPVYWRQQAEKLRAQALRMRDPKVRLGILDIADRYDELAARVEALGKVIRAEEGLDIL